ncbi:hypothetical protein FEE59_09835 [Herbaspirillum sp. RU 5E]|nr:hypothetical protein [Herbaspirillum sp. RU 5E]
MQDQKIIGSITFTSGLRAGKTVPGVWSDMGEANRKAMAERASIKLPVVRVDHSGDLAQASMRRMQNGCMSGSVMDVDDGGLL